MSEIQKVEEAAAAAEATTEAKAEESTTEAEATKSGEEKKEVAISEALGEDPGKAEEKPKVTVPEAAFLEEKKGRKTAEAEVARLQKQLAESGNTPLSDSDLDSIATEHNVDPDFLKKFSTSVATTVRKEMEGVMKNKFDELDRASRQTNFDTTFDNHFNEVVKNLPEFKSVADKESVKAVVLEHLRSDDPKKKNTTLLQILEKMYGKAAPGKRTIEVTKPGGSKEPGTVDRARADRDPAYLAEIMANPELKKEYNKGMTDRLAGVL